MRAQLLRSLGRLQPIRGRPAIQCGKRLRSNDGDVTIAIKAMRDITSGHLRSSGGTKHLCLGLLGTLWFTRGRLPQVQATLQSVSITLSYFFHLLGLFGPLQPERRHFPSVWGLLSVDSAAGLLRGGISSDQCHCGRPKTVVARHFLASLGGRPWTNWTLILVRLLAATIPSARAAGRLVVDLEDKFFH